MMTSRSIAIGLLAVLVLDATQVRAQRPKSETGYDEIQAKKKEEERKKQEAEQKKQETPTSTDPCADLSTKLENIDGATEALGKAHEAFGPKRDAVTNKITELRPTFVDYSTDYDSCNTNEDTQVKLTKGLTEIRLMFLDAMKELDTALNAVPPNVLGMAGPKAAIGEYKALRAKAEIAVADLTYTVKNPLVCTMSGDDKGWFLKTKYDPPLVEQWLVAVGDTLQRLSAAAKIVIDAGTGDVVEALTDDKNATCQPKMQEFYEKKGGKYDELIAKKGNKNKLTRRKKLEEMDPESYLTGSGRLDQKTGKVTIKSGDTLWSIAKGMVKNSEQSNKNINDMMHKLIKALKKENPKADPNRLADNSTIDLESILAQG